MTATRPRIGLGISTFEPGVVDQLYGDAPFTWTGMLELVRAAEDAGVDSVWLPDHLLFRDAGGAWETFSLLAALAASTSRIELGTLVANVGFRNPALLAKMAETIDEISGGRLVLGLGAGGRRRGEYDAFGYPFDRRVDRLEEALQVLAPLLRTGRCDFQGEFFQIADCEIRPRGPRPGAIPLMIGSTGHGPRMMELSARYADIWSGWFAFGDSWPTAVAPVLPLLDAACIAQGRDPATLRRAVTVNWVLPEAMVDDGAAGTAPLRGTIAEVAAAMRSFADMGIELVQIIPNPCDLRGIDSICRLVRELER